MAIAYPALTEEGTPAEVAPPLGVAEEIRRRRRLLHLSLRQAAKRTGVTYSVICEIENGRRVPSIRTYEKLRSGLGLEAPAAVLIRPRVRTEVTSDHLLRLAACVVLQRGGSLATLAEALGISIPAVREGLGAIGERLAGVGLRAVEDGDVVRLGPLPAAAPGVAAIASLQPLPEISAEQLEVIAIVAHLGSATRREIERLRGEASETLIRRLVDRGLVEKAGDIGRSRSPSIYRITTTALAITGHSTVESLQSFLAEAMAGQELAQREALGTSRDDGSLDARIFSGMVRPGPVVSTRPH